MDDAEAVARFLETRNPEFFEVLVHRYQERVFRLAISILGPGLEPEAEEVAQEVFLKAFRRIHGFRMQSSFYTWLYRLTFNLALDTRARARLRLPHVSDQVLAREIDRSPASDPFSTALSARQREVVRQCIEELPHLYRSVLYQAYWLGCSVEEIALTLEAHANTIKSYLHRARQRLHSLLSERGIEGSHDLL